MRSYQLGNTSLHAFRALRHISHNQNRLSQCRRFFLNTAGIRKNKVSGIQMGNKRLIGKRLGKNDAGVITEYLHNRFLNLRIKMHGIHERYIGIRICQLAHGIAYFNKSVTKIFTSMPRNKDDSMAFFLSLHHTLIKKMPLALNLSLHPLQSIDNGIARYKRIFGVHSFPYKIGIGHFSRSKMQIGNLTDNFSIHFLRKRRPFIEAAQSCLYVTYSNISIKSTHGTRHDRRSISLNKHPVWLLLYKYPINFLKETR